MRNKIRCLDDDISKGLPYKNQKAIVDIYVYLKKLCNAVVIFQLAIFQIEASKFNSIAINSASRELKSCAWHMKQVVFLEFHQLNRH